MKMMLTYLLVFGGIHVLVRGLETLQVGWIVPSSQHPDSSFPYNASSSVAALALGLETIRNDSILPDYQFNITWLDSDCNSKQSIGLLVDTLVSMTLDVVLGPPCSQVVQSVGELLAYRNTPVINWVSIGQSITSAKASSDVDTYIRTMAPISSLGGIMILFYYYTGWRRFCIVSGRGEDYVATADTIQDNLGTGFVVAHHYNDVINNASDAEIDAILSSIIFEARIIILVIPHDELRHYMLRASALGMVSGDYQFLYTDPVFADERYTAVIKSDVWWRKGDENDDIARRAFENVLYFVLGMDAVDVSVWGNQALAAADRVFANRHDIPLATTPDEYSVFLHDSVLLYARALNRSLTEGWSNNGTSIFRWTPYAFFTGLSGDVVMSFLCDRQPNFFVYDFNSNGVFHQVANLQYSIDGDSVAVNSTFTQIVWGDGRATEAYIPPDTPACGFYNELCPAAPAPSNNDTVVIIAVSVTMLVVLLVLLLIYRWWRWEQGLKNMYWKILPKDLDFAVSKRTPSSLNISGRFAQSTVSLSSSKGTVLSGRRPSSTASVGGMSATKRQIFTTIALYKGEIVAVKKIRKKKLNIDRALLLEMKYMTEVKHANLTGLLGLCTTTDNICSVWEYCAKGSIQDVIENDDIRLDAMFKLSLAVDLCQGLDYIHKSPLKVHGNMKSSNCVIDNRWVCKLTDFGLPRVKTGQDNDPEVLGEHAYYAKLFWTSPELLQAILKRERIVQTTAADIYALGVVMKELLCRNEPYCDESLLSPKEIIMKVAYPGDEESVFRPPVTDIGLDSEYHCTNMEYLIHRCWAQDPDLRPSIKGVLRTINKINPYKKSSVVDNMIAMMEKYTTNLEDVVAARTEQVEEEKRKTDALLYRMLPQKVAENLKSGLSVEAETFDSVTIYFSDIVEFTTLAGESTPMEVVAFLNALYTVFDDIISHYDVYKVGLHTGSVVAGVVGLTMPRYCLFGDTVNTASRMESNGKALKVHISASTNAALRDFPEFRVEERGEIPIKGKGMMTTYWLLEQEPTGPLYPPPPHAEESNSVPDGGVLAAGDLGVYPALGGDRHGAGGKALEAGQRSDESRVATESSCQCRNTCKCTAGRCQSEDSVETSELQSTSSSGDSFSSDIGYEEGRETVDGEILTPQTTTPETERQHMSVRNKSRSRHTKKHSYDTEDLESGIKSCEDSGSQTDRPLSGYSRNKSPAVQETTVNIDSRSQIHVTESPPIKELDRFPLNVPRVEVLPSSDSGCGQHHAKPIGTDVVRQEVLAAIGNKDDLPTLHSPARVSATDFMSVNKIWTPE